MKKYSEPSAIIMTLVSEDVITASTIVESLDLNGNFGGFCEFE